MPPEPIRRPPPSTHTETPEQPEKVLAHGDTFAIDNTSYQVRLISPTIGFSETGDLSFWNEGKGWVINRYHPNLKDGFSSQWPVDCISSDRSRAVVQIQREHTWPHYLAVADLTKNQLIVSGPSGEFFGADAWRFSPDGKYAWAIKGHARGGFAYFDLEQKKLTVVPVKGMSPDIWCQWTGILLDEGRTVCLFVRQEPWKPGPSKRVTFSAANPGELSVEDNVLGLSAIRQGQKGLLCWMPGKTYVSPNRMVEVFTKTWKIVREIRNPDEQTALQGTPDAGGEVMYCRDERNYPAGLCLRRAKDGKELAFVSLGVIFNARWLGPTFSADGRWVLASAPYAESVTVIDTASRAAVQKLKFREAKTGGFLAPAGAFLIPPDKPAESGVLLVITTELPFE